MCFQKLNNEHYTKVAVGHLNRLLISVLNEKGVKND